MLHDGESQRLITNTIKFEELATQKTAGVNDHLSGRQGYTTTHGQPQ